MGLAKSCAEGVLDEATWTCGSPSERSLVALFAVLKPAELDTLLRSVSVLVLAELKPSPELRDMLSGDRAFDAAGFDFPGGESLVDVFEWRESSTQLHRVPIKSISHAIEAVQAAVGAVLEHRKSQDIAEAWRFVLSVIRDRQLLGYD